MSATNSISADLAKENLPRIFVIANNLDDIQALLHYLEKTYYQVEVSTKNNSVLEKYQEFKPDLVLVDINSDKQEGFDLVDKMTFLSGRELVPIIYLAPEYSDEALSECIANDGADLLSQPYDENILKAKLYTYTSLARLDRSAKTQRQELEDHNKQLASNYEIAIDVFENVIHSDALDSPAICYSISPTSIFNGDILLAAHRPSGELQVMLGDFTGHGLSAAIGTIPVADIFYGMTAKGFGISEIIVEINAKVKKILPRGLFLAACLFEYDIESRKITIWNAGLPDALIFDDQDKHVKYQFNSRNYPLGVSDTVSYSTTVENYYISENERLLFFTDGIIEARNPKGKMYGIDNVISCICNTTAGQSVIEPLTENITMFTQGIKQADDTTVIEVHFSKLQKPDTAQKNKNNNCTFIFNSDWRIDYTFEPTILKVFDPLPNIIQMIMEVQKLHCHKQNIFIIIKELFVNALDHGLLGLDSEIKNGPDGFSNYVVERQKRLEALTEGEITITIAHTGTSDGGSLDVYISDTGKGFDTSIITSLLKNDSQYHSRGIFMTNSICEKLEYSNFGRKVHAQYCWKA